MIRRAPLHRSIPDRALYIFFAAVIVVAGFVTLNPDNLAARMLGTVWLWPSPERVTELYFTNPTKLPTTFETTENLPILFTTHSLEHQAIFYEYKIIQSSADGSQTHQLADGSFSLDHDQTKQTAAIAELHDVPGQSKISVQLTRGAVGTMPPHTYTIFFWINNAGEGATQ